MLPGETFFYLKCIDAPGILCSLLISWSLHRCGHCNRLAPTWDELASELKGKVNVANVDCTAHGDLCKKFEVKGYPTLLHFNGGKYYKFKGARDLETLAKFAVGGFIAVVWIYIQTIYSPTHFCPLTKCWADDSLGIILFQDGTNVPGSTHWLEYLSMEMLMTSGRALAKLANECISECVKDIQVWMMGLLAIIILLLTLYLSV